MNQGLTYLPHRSISTHHQSTQGTLPPVLLLLLPPPTSIRMGGPGAGLGEGKATAMAAEGDEGWRRGLMSIGGSGSSTGGGGGSGGRLLSSTRGGSGVGGLDAKVSQSPR